MTADTPELPEPPEPRDLYGECAEGYEADQMRAYGQSCYAAGMEKAAKIAEQLMHADIDGSVEWRKARYSGLYEAAAAIRAAESVSPTPADQRERPRA
jgi:hypothetical protein